MVLCLTGLGSWSVALPSLALPSITLPSIALSLVPECWALSELVDMDMGLMGAGPPALTVHSKGPLQQVLGGAHHGADHREGAAAVLVLLVGLAQQLRLEVPVILTPADRGRTLNLCVYR